ncbi:TPA: ATP-binding protein [Acinetobacter baumannii]
MALAVIKPTEVIPVNAIKLYIYGDPSIGKTSLAMTCPKALLIDADAGVYRAGALRRSDVQLAEYWQQVNALEQADLVPYDTIIIDTVGRLLDVIKNHIAENPYNVKSDGGLKQNAFGIANNLFAGFVNRMIGYGKNVVFLAHAVEDKDGDEVIKRPDLGGKNRQEVYRLSDCMAYFCIEKGRSGKNKKVLKFGKSEGLHTKDCANLGMIEVPDITNQPTYLGDLIDHIKAHLNTLTPEQRKHAEQEQAWLHWQQLCHDAKYASDFNNLMEELALHVEHPQYQNMWRGMKYCASQLNINYNQDDKRWYEQDAA